MKVTLVVRVVNNDYTAGAYVRELDLPFLPTVGMKFKQGTSTWLWETTNGNELDPPVKEVVYNLDEEVIYCLFEVEEFLASSFWTKHCGFELSQFSTHG